MTNRFEQSTPVLVDAPERAEFEALFHEVLEMPAGTDRDEAAQILGELYPEFTTGTEEAEVTGFMDLLERNQMSSRIGHDNLSKAKALLPPKPVVEIVPEQIPGATENLLASRGILAVVRAAEYEDFYTDIVPQLQSSGLRMVKTEMFPEAHSAITGGSSYIHLDNFAEVDAPEYRYSFSASRVNKGRMIFIGGQATAHARDAHRTEHLQDRRELRRVEQILDIEREAIRGKAPASTLEFTARNAKGERLHAIRGKLVAVALGEDDVVLWAQGGPGSEMPLWHAVQQVGNPDHPAFQARSSTSMHFVKEL